MNTLLHPLAMMFSASGSSRYSWKPPISNNLSNTARSTPASACRSSTWPPATGAARLHACVGGRDRASFTIALQAARDQIVNAAKAITDTTIDLVGAIGRQIL